MDAFIHALEETAGKILSVSQKTKNGKLQWQLLIASVHLRNDAVALRKGSVTLPDSALARCGKELSDASDRAERAKNEDDYAAVLVEANEAVLVIAQHFVPAGAQNAEASTAQALMNARALGQATMPMPEGWPPNWPHFPLPRNWPEPLPFPLPMPPWPHPIPVPPWPCPSPWWHSAGWGRGI